MSKEMLDIVNERGEVIGQAQRDEIHRGRLLHRVVHLLVFDSSGRLLLQKRSLSKDVAPGKWDTSVGGHMDRGESVRAALCREMYEELRLKGCDTEFLYSYIHADEHETELVYSFRCFREQIEDFDTEEIDEIRYWDVKEIEAGIQSDIFSEHFKDEFRRYLDFVRVKK